jgi:hypothetical protein
VPKITLEIPEELSEQLSQIGDRLPELLALSLKQPALPAHIYYYILDFLSSNPTPQQIAEFRPTSETNSPPMSLKNSMNTSELNIY